MATSNLLLRKEEPMESEWIGLMKRVLKGQITDPDRVKEIRQNFNDEFGPEALKILKGEMKN